MTAPLNICFPLEVDFLWIMITCKVWRRVSGLWELLDICVLCTAKMNIRIESTECDSRIFGMLADLIDWYDVYTVVFSLALYFVNTRCVRCDSLASCQQTCMTYTIAVCTVENSWWWTEELSETYRVLFQKWSWEISASSWFYLRTFNYTFYNKGSFGMKTCIYSIDYWTHNGYASPESTYRPLDPPSLELFLRGIKRPRPKADQRPQCMA